MFLRSLTAQTVRMKPTANIKTEENEVAKYLILLKVY